MEKESILEKILLELEELAKDPKNIRDYSKFHKDGKDHVGIATPLVRKLSSKHFKEAKSLGKEQIFNLCEKLLKAKTKGCREIAFDWAYRARRGYEKGDFDIFENWLEKYVDDWGGCDDLCTHALGEFVFQFPESLPKMKGWTKSENKWFRRASAVVLIYPLRKGKCLKEALETARTLMRDEENLVQKGYGWMLKEASKRHQKDVVEFLLANKKTMNRTALRYAAEKLPEQTRREVMN